MIYPPRSYFMIQSLTIFRPIFGSIILVTPTTLYCIKRSGFEETHSKPAKNTGIFIVFREMFTIFSFKQLCSNDDSNNNDNNNNFAHILMISLLIVSFVVVDVIGAVVVVLAGWLCGHVARCFPLLLSKSCCLVSCAARM